MISSRDPAGAFQPIPFPLKLSCPRERANVPFQPFHVSQGRFSLSALPLNPNNCPPAAYTGPESVPQPAQSVYRPYNPDYMPITGLLPPNPPAEHISPFPPGLCQKAQTHRISPQTLLSSTSHRKHQKGLCPPLWAHHRGKGLNTSSTNLFPLHRPSNL